MKARLLLVFMLIAIAVCGVQNVSSYKEIAIGALSTLTGDWASNFG